jgi:hypothetical protein
MPELAPDPTPPSRVELLQLAQSLGVSDADVMTRAELRAAIDKARRPEPRAPDPQPITWVSVARRLIASVVERGLNLPDAASLIRGDTKLNAPFKAPPPVATVTLARIYGAQGHIDRAISTLDEVLQSDPDHELARDLRTQLELRRVDLIARGESLGPSAPPRRVNASDSPRRPPEPAISPAISPAMSPASATAGEPVPSEAPASQALEPPSVEVFEALPRAQPAPLAVAPIAEPEPLATPANAEVRALGAEPPSMPPPPFVDAPYPAEAPASAQPPPFVHAEPVDDAPASTEAWPHAEPPQSIQPPPFVDSPSSAAAPPSIEASDATSDGDTSVPPPTRLDDSAELVAPAFDVVERDIAAELLDDSRPSPNSTAPIEAELPASGEPNGEPRHAPNGVANGVALDGDLANGAQPTPPPIEPSAPLPQVPGLVLIETGTPIRYVYWELATAGLGAPPHWIHIVSHTATAHGNTERHERHFPVHRQLGALRLEGVPPQAVVRARLTQTNDSRPLVVAGAVRPRAPGAEPFEIRYSPQPSAKPETLASRAQPLLERASPVYWDDL